MSKIKYIKNMEFFETWSPDLAYILGFVMADGYVNHNGLFIALKDTDIEILEYIRNKISPNSKIRHKNIFDNRYNKEYKKVSLEIYSVNIANRLLEFGIIQAKTRFECISPNLPKEYFGDFLRGYFDGDGNVGKDYGHPLYCCICCANLDFLKECQIRCNNIGYIYPHSGIYYWRMSALDSLKFKDIIYPENCCFALKRKRDIFDSFTKNDLQLIKLEDKDIEYIKNSVESRDVIAKNLNVVPTTISRRRKELGIQRRCVKWTEQELNQLRELLEEGLSLIEIAIRLNRNKNEVNRQSKQFKRWKNSWTEEEIKFLQENSFKNRKDIALALGRSERSINSKMFRLGLI